jgi:hypothetical protein
MTTMARISAINTVLAATYYETFFPGTEGVLSENGKWLNGGTDGLDWFDNQSAAGKAYATNIDSVPGGTKDNVSQLKRSFLACTSNQFAEATIFKAGGYSGGVVTHEIEVFVNMTIAAHSTTGYELYLNIGGNHSLVRWDGAQNSFTPLASNNAGNGNMPAYADGDVIRIERVGNTLNCYHRTAAGSFILYTTFNDTTFTGGNPGFGTNPANDAGGSPVVSSAGLSRWKGGNFP